MAGNFVRNLQIPAHIARSALIRDLFGCFDPNAGEQIMAIAKITVRT